MCYRMGGLKWCVSGQRRHRKMLLGRQQPKGFKCFAPPAQYSRLQTPAAPLWKSDMNPPTSCGQKVEVKEPSLPNFRVTRCWRLQSDGETCKLLQSMEKAGVLEMVNLAFQGHHKGNGENKKLKVLRFYLFYVHNCPYEYMCSMCVSCS